MHRRLTLLAGAAVLAAGPALAQTQQQRAQSAQGQAGGPAQTTTPAPSSTASRAEVVTAQEFVRLASMSDRFEIASGHLAQEKSQNAEVKRFAEHMVRDHTKTAQELQGLIQQLPDVSANLATPPAPGRETAGTTQDAPRDQGLDQQHTALLQQLQQASGAEFDRLYVRQQVMAHQQAVDMFRNYAQSGDKPQLKQWAERTLPALQEHLRLAQQLQQSTQG
jgi:putative membrane protein